MHGAAEIVRRHNLQFKELGRVKTKHLAVCMHAEDRKGYKLTNDMILQGLQACAATCPVLTGCLLTDASVLFRFCAQPRQSVPVCIHRRLHFGKSQHVSHMLVDCGMSALCMCATANSALLHAIRLQYLTDHMLFVSMHTLIAMQSTYWLRCQIGCCICNAYLSWTSSHLKKLYAGCKEGRPSRG